MISRDVLDSRDLSQFCLEDLSSSGCEFSQFCWYIKNMSGNILNGSCFCRSNMWSSSSRMYTATHMVLYNYIVTRLDCEAAVEEAAKARVGSLCSRILPEAEELHNQILRSGEKIDHCHVDLWLEQSIDKFVELVSSLRTVFSKLLSGPGRGHQLPPAVLAGDPPLPDLHPVPLHHQVRHPSL